MCCSFYFLGFCSEQSELHCQWTCADAGSCSCVRGRPAILQMGEYSIVSQYRIYWHWGPHMGLIYHCPPSSCPTPSCPSSAPGLSIPVGILQKSLAFPLKLGWVTGRVGCSHSAEVAAGTFSRTGAKCSRLQSQERWGRDSKRFFTKIYLQFSRQHSMIHTSTQLLTSNSTQL